MDDMEEIICPCYDLTLKNLVDAIKEHNITTVEELSNVTGAGNICGACMDDLEKIVEKYKAK